MPLKIDWRPPIGLPRRIHPRMNIPIRATIDVSRRIANVTKMRITKAAYTQ
jgi:hypothetical protein